MTTIAGEGDGEVSPHDPVKRPWTPPRLVVHGKVPALTFGATSLKTADEE
jgi:hypothetical protein